LLRATVGGFKPIAVELTNIGPALPALQRCLTQRASFPEVGAEPKVARDPPAGPAIRRRLFGTDTASVDAASTSGTMLCRVAIDQGPGVSFYAFVQRGGAITIIAAGPQLARPGQNHNLRISPENPPRGSIAFTIDPAREDDLVDALAASTSVRVSNGPAVVQTYQLPQARQLAAELRSCLTDIRAVNPPARLTS
jgi:hypothetical protein